MFTTIALVASLSTAAAGESLGRSLQGELVRLDQTTLVVFWSVDCGCGGELEALEEAGFDLVMVNTDAASEGSQVRHFARQHELSSPIVTDPDGELRARYAMDHGLVLLDGEGQVLASAHGDPAPALARMELQPASAVVASN